MIRWIIGQADINGFAIGKFNDPLDELRTATTIFRPVIALITIVCSSS